VVWFWNRVFPFPLMHSSETCGAVVSWLTSHILLPRRFIPVERVGAILLQSVSAPQMDCATATGPYPQAQEFKSPKACPAMTAIHGRRDAPGRSLAKNTRLCVTVRRQCSI